MERKTESLHLATPSNFFQPSSENFLSPLIEIKKLLESGLDFSRSLTNTLMLGSDEEKFEVCILLSFPSLSESHKAHLKKKWFINNGQILKATCKNVINTLIYDITEYNSLLTPASSSHVSNEVIDRLYLMLHFCKQRNKYIEKNTLETFREIFVNTHFADQNKAHRSRCLRKLRSEKNKSVIALEEEAMLNKCTSLAEALCFDNALDFAKIITETFENTGDEELQTEGILKLLIKQLCSNASNMQKYIVTNIKKLESLTKEKIQIQSNQDVLTTTLSPEDTFKQSSMLSKKTNPIENIYDVFAKTKTSGYFELLKIHDNIKAKLKAAHDEVKTSSKSPVDNNNLCNESVKKEIIQKTKKTKASQRHKKKQTQKQIPIPKKMLTEEKFQSTQASKDDAISKPAASPTVSLPKSSSSIIANKDCSKAPQTRKSTNKTGASKKSTLPPTLSSAPASQSKVIQRPVVITPCTKRLAQQLTKYRDNFELMFSKPTPNRQMSFKDLCQLVIAADGSFKPIGGSKYRLQLKNIYAEVIKPDDESNNDVQKVSFVAHAPTKGNRKGHNFKGNVLGYVVDLFRRAFERADITPQVLWPEKKSLPPRNNYHSYKK